MTSTLNICESTPTYFHPNIFPTDPIAPPGGFHSSRIQLKCIKTCRLNSLLWSNISAGLALDYKLDRYNLLLFNPALKFPKDLKQKPYPRVLSVLECNKPVVVDNQLCRIPMKPVVPDYISLILQNIFQQSARETFEGPCRRWRVYINGVSRIESPWDAFRRERAIQKRLR